MRITDLVEEQEFKILILIGNQTMEFESKVIKPLPKKHVIYATPVIKNGKVVSLNGKGVSTNIIVSFPDSKPLIFRNAVIVTMKRDDGTYYYSIVANGEGVEFNRRDSFRCPVDVPGILKIGAEKETYDVIIRDVSINGFSFCFKSFDEKCEVGLFVHTVLNDYLSQLYENYTFQLYGLVVREFTLENGKSVYGCKLVQKVDGIEAYIAKKERVRLQQQRNSDRTQWKAE